MFLKVLVNTQQFLDTDECHYTIFYSKAEPCGLGGLHPQNKFCAILGKAPRRSQKESEHERELKNGRKHS